MTIRPSIRPATPEDVDAAAETLGQAFADYPFTRHTVDARDHGARVDSLQRLYLAEIGMRCGRVWVSDDLAAVSVWITPSSSGLDEAFGDIASRVVDLYGDRANVAARADEATAGLRPAEPVWNLATVGVAPHSQGRGLGRAVLEPGLEAARTEGYAAYLETSSPENVRFYERLGFEVTGKVSLPDDGRTCGPWSGFRDCGCRIPTSYCLVLGCLSGGVSRGVDAGDGGLTVTYRLEAEKGVIEGVGKTLAECSNATRALWSGSTGFADAAAAMPGSAFNGACAGKDDLVRTLLGRAAARMDAVSQTCYQVATEFADTDEELASGFRAISVF